MNAWWLVLAFVAGAVTCWVLTIGRYDSRPSWRIGRVVIVLRRWDGRLVGSIYFGSSAAIHWRCRDGRWLMYEKALR